MMKYPYTYEEYEAETIKKFKKDYPSQYETIDEDEMKEEIKESYLSDKFKYESGMIDEVLSIDKEVKGAVYNLSMF